MDFKIFSLAALAAVSAYAIVPNKLVSSGLPAYTGDKKTEYLTDGYLTNWKNSREKNIAINVGEGPSKLFITWESFGDCAWATDFTTNCSHSGTALSNFKILTSANSTNGTDGDWEIAATIEDNPVMARGVDIEFAGKSWFKFQSEEDVGQILEIEAFDISNGGNDTWFFMGTSISQMGLKQQDTDSTTAQLIHARFPDFTPAMLRGGIGCINSTEVVEHLEEYLKYAGNVHYWAIEMGTNDAWGGGDWNLDTYIGNMQTIIDSAKAHGITPVIARIIATNPQKVSDAWQVNPKFLEALDSLVEVNDLPKGPDFYNYFLEHPELIGDDGVHPNSKGGGQAMHHLWAEALAPLYENKDDENKNDTEAKPENPEQNPGNASGIVPSVIFKMPQVKINGNEISLTNIASAQVAIVSTLGKVLETHHVNGSQSIKTSLSAGQYTLIIRSTNNSIAIPVAITNR